MIGLTSNAFILDLPVGDVVQFALPVIGSLFDTLHDRRYQPWSSAWAIIWVVGGLISLLRCTCSCGELFSRIYAERLPRPKLLSQLQTHCAPEDADKTSGRSSDTETIDSSRERSRSNDGLVAASRNYHCILIYGDQNNRLGQKT